MPLARHDDIMAEANPSVSVSTHMPLARHDASTIPSALASVVSTHMPLARHDVPPTSSLIHQYRFLLTCLLRGMTVF